MNENKGDEEVGKRKNKREKGKRVKKKSKKKKKKKKKNWTNPKKRKIISFSDGKFSETECLNKIFPANKYKIIQIFKNINCLTLENL